MVKMRTDSKRPDLGNGLYYALTGLSQKSEGTTTQQKAKDLLRRSRFSKAKAAEAAGVSKETFRRWVKGDQEASPEHFEKLQEAQRRARLKPRVAKKFADSGRGTPPGGAPEGGLPPGSSLRIEATVRWSDDERTRWIDVGQDIPYGQLDQVMELMVTKGPEAAGERLMELISTHYFRATGAEVTEIHQMRW